MKYYPYSKNQQIVFAQKPGAGFRNKYIIITDVSLCLQVSLRNRKTPNFFWFVELKRKAKLISMNGQTLPIISSFIFSRFSLANDSKRMADLLTPTLEGSISRNFFKSAKQIKINLLMLSNQVSEAEQP